MQNLANRIRYVKSTSLVVFSNMTIQIKRRLSFIINFLLLKPLSFGNPTEEGISDGSTSSAVSFACGFAILLITIVYFTVQFTMEKFSSNSMWGLMLFLIAIGIIVAALLVSTACCQLNGVIQRQQLKDKCVELEIKFLWFSGLGIILQTGLFLVIYFECIKYSSDSWGIFKIISSFLKIMFFLIQMSFITFLRNTRLLGGIFINYLIGVLFLANTSIWVNFVTLNVVYIHDFFNITISLTNSSALNDCYYHSKTQKISRHLSSFSLSVSMLFFLLSSMFLIRLWPSIENVSKMSNRMTLNKCTVSNTSSEQPNANNRASKSRRIVRIISFWGSFLINFPFFTMALLMRYVYTDDINTVKVFWDLFVIFCLTVMVLIIVFGIQNLNLNCIEKRPFSTWEFIFLVSMASKVVMSILGCTSIFICLVDKPRTIFTKNLLDLILTLYHSVYIRVARRMPQFEFDKSIANLSIHVILFCSCLGRWFLQTFILSSEGMHIFEEGKQCLFTDRRSWHTTQYVLIPLNAFYDFQSFIFYYGKI